MRWESWTGAVCSWGCHQRAGGCLPAELLKPGGYGTAEEGASCRRQNGGECAEPQPYRGKEVGCCIWGRDKEGEGSVARGIGGCALRVGLHKFSELKALQDIQKLLGQSWSNFCSVLVQERGSCLTIHSWGAQLSVLKTSFILLVVFVPHSSSFHWDVGFPKLFKLH